MDKENGFHLSKALKSDITNITSLDISSNNLGDEGLSYLCSALKCNTKLLKLDMSANYITDIGAKDICLTLTNNKTLYLLWFQWNCITDIGGKHFLDLIKKNKTITDFTLYANKVTLTLLSEIRFILYKNTKTKVKQRIKLLTYDMKKITNFLPEEWKYFKFYSLNISSKILFINEDIASVRSPLIVDLIY